MIQYRVTYNINADFGCNYREVVDLESNEAISRKEIASRLGIAIDSIIDIKVI